MLKSPDLLFFTQKYTAKDTLTHLCDLGQVKKKNASLFLNVLTCNFYYRIAVRIKGLNAC